ncbi:hypothetical protein CC1G_09307 [Coprinopsis cinerea okayama7|uniref:Uncharacterized protein n=1 Tax=Coprinopsis cinerea (strain Okayama-7 / 130 / ATCC MYA-4618 / FGSC 9003) TaxID=240176 RepID=A8N5K2_COPC7|nr:hypothetical protein CC1G_09307 [Coprinopsis cinerea okayama7\|eukprot:XP_001830147.1 hypothetical protein CC1G_09307 [Coprinopsis cinerea okayama7\
MTAPATIAVAPSEEEDIARTRPWDHEEAGIERRRSKGKEKDLADGFTDTDRDKFIDSPGFSPSSYPPTNDEQAESRRVEETLKQWEAAELQRRKAARQSVASSPSLVDNVSRRASLLLSGRNRKSGSISNASLGTHAPLPTQDSDLNSDVLPLTSIPASPTPSPSRSEADIERLDDPFNPPTEARSPFADPTPSASSASLSEDPSLAQTSALAPLTPTCPASFTSRQPPPALPLGLPPPKTPPPIAQSPAAPQSTSTDDVNDKPTKWWHEWLCGCGEGPDRGGDHQAGKTNPFE